MNPLFSLLLVMVLSGSVFAQDLKADFKAMQARYREIENFYAEIDVEVYLDGAPSELLVTRNAVLKKKGDDFFYVLGEMRMLLNERCILVINDATRDIVYRKRSPEDEDPSFYTVTTPEMDRVIAAYDSVRYLGIKNGNKHYEIFTSRSPIARTNLYLDEKTRMFKKLVYHYSKQTYGQGQTAIVTYREMNEAPVFPTETFSETRYVVRSDKGLKVSPEFADYNLTVTEETP